MKMRDAFIVVGVCVVSSVGCGGGRGVERGVAEKACVHQVELGVWKGFEGSFKSQGLQLDDAARAEAAKELEKLRGLSAFKAEVDKCTDGFSKMATQANIDCVLAAKTSDDAMACLK